MELVEEAKPDEDGERSAEAVDLVLDDVTAIFFFFERLYFKEKVFFLEEGEKAFFFF